jgi:hypothetical protein
MTVSSPRKLTVDHGTVCQLRSALTFLLGAGWLPCPALETAFHLPCCFVLAHAPRRRHPCGSLLAHVPGSRCGRYTRFVVPRHCGC